MALHKRKLTFKSDVVFRKRSCVHPKSLLLFFPGQMQKIACDFKASRHDESSRYFAASRLTSWPEIVFCRNEVFFPD